METVSRSTLVVYLAKQGVDVPEWRLERWHKAGLLPRPKRIHLGRGRGTESRYPIQAASQALFLALARPRCRTLSHLAWVAWVNGFPVTDRVRRLIIGYNRGGGELAKRDLAAFEDELPENPIDSAVTSRPPRGFPRMPKHMRPTLARIIREFRSGQFDASRYTREEIAVLIRQPKLLRSNLSPDAVRIAQRISRALNDTMNGLRVADFVEALSTDRLEQRRDQARRIWADLSARFGRLGPLPFNVFMLWLMVDVSPDLRLIRRLASRKCGELGFTSLEEAFRAELVDAGALRKLKAPLGAREA